MVKYHSELAFDGWWLDISDLSSWCTGSCGTGRTEDNPIHVPFRLPGEPGQINYDYPEAFEVTNSTDAASASAASASQASAYPTPTTTIGTPTFGFTNPTPGVRNVKFPPYALNLTLEGHSLLRQAVASYASHNDPYNTTEYELHNVYGYISARASYNALEAVKPGLRPFLLARSTSPGSGTLAGHWGGDTNSRWGNMYMTISQALTFSIAGIPFFGVETCGFNGNTDMELCTRWMQLSALFPLYRNHNSRNTISQEGKCQNPQLWNPSNQIKTQQLSDGLLQQRARAEPCKSVSNYYHIHILSSGEHIHLAIPSCERYPGTSHPKNFSSLSITSSCSDLAFSSRLSSRLCCGKQEVSSLGLPPEQDGMIGII